MYRIILSVVILRVRKIIYLLNTKNEIEWVFIWNDQLFCKYKRAYDQLHAKIKRTHTYTYTNTHARWYEQSTVGHSVFDCHCRYMTYTYVVRSATQQYTQWQWQQQHELYVIFYLLLSSQFFFHFCCQTFIENLE